MNELKIFENPEFGEIRAIEINGEPWLVGKDVAAALGYSDTDKAIRNHVDDEDKLTRQFGGSGQNRNMTVVNESGLYSLVLSSKLPGAKIFRRWVTSEVLPSIRKHGMYATEDTLEAMLDDPDTAIRLLQEIKSKREKLKILERTVDVQRQQIAEMQPKASYYDVVLNCKDLVTISTIAKDYGWNANHMNAYLHEAGVQYKQGNIWLLYQKYAEQGYTSTKTHLHRGGDGEIHSKVHTYWTQKGRLFLYDLLKADGILPIIEQDGCAA